MDCSADETKASDDIFADSSAETIVENVDFSLILKKANILNNSDNNVLVTEKSDFVINAERCCGTAASISNCTVKLYCPFCCSAFTSQNILKGHMKDKHLDYLKNMSVNGIDTVMLYCCRYCHARYNTLDLLVNHTAVTHQDNVIVGLLLQDTDKRVSCAFCPYRTLIGNKQGILAHMVEYHFSEFKTFIKEKSKHMHLSPERTSHSSISVLYNLLLDIQKQFPTVSSVEKTLKSTLRVTSPSLTENQKEKRNVRFQLNEPSTRRQLNFNIEDKRDFERTIKENIISCSTNMRPFTRYPPSSTEIQPKSKWKSVFSFKNKQKRDKKVSKLVTSTPVTQTDIRRKQMSRKPKDRRIKQSASVIHGPVCDKSVDSMARVLKKEEIGSDVRGSECNNWTPPEEPYQQYKCALCLQAFVNNVDLVTHAHHHHTGPLKILQPLFKCGQCEAKFYKNSFLLKHCRLHHTPRCLKNKLPS